MLPQVKEIGQLTLLQSRVSLIGIGGTGCHTAVALVRAGIGSLQIIDFDSIERSNLQRQILFRESDIGKLKTVVACEQLLQHNPDLNCRVESQKASREHLQNFQPHIVVDCSDDSSSLEVVHCYCRQNARPLVYTRASQFLGIVANFQYATPDSPCIYCFEEQPHNRLQQSCQTLGVFTPLLGVVGNILAATALQLLLKNPVNDASMQLVDLQYNQIENFEVPQSIKCPECGHRIKSATE